jgi:putative DNA primase/helicase
MNLNELPLPYQALLKLNAKPRVHRVSPNDPAAVTPGHRNTTLTSIAGKLLRDGLSQAAIRAALIEQNKTFTPPLPVSEVDRIVTSITRYPVGSNDRSTDPATELMDRVLEADFAGGDHLIYISGTFWTFDVRRWRPITDESLARAVLNAVGVVGLPRGYRPAALAREVISLLKARAARDDDPLRFHADPYPVVNCRNGEVWLEGGIVDFRPHSAKSYQRSCLDLDYDPNAACPLYDTALRDIFARSSAPEEMAELWNTLTGYTIQPTRRHPLIILAWGIGSNGKTSLADTLIRLIGQSSVYAGQVQKLSEGRFTFAMEGLSYRPPWGQRAPRGSDNQTLLRHS